MKKKIKKFLSRFVPKGALKERIKQFYYNLLSKTDTSFGISTHPDNGITLYETKYRGLTFTTLDPLYTISEDFDFYQNFYKVHSGDVIMDAGANSGYISLLFSKLAGTKGKVYAFEPAAEH